MPIRSSRQSVANKTTNSKAHTSTSINILQHLYILHTFNYIFTYSTPLKHQLNHLQTCQTIPEPYLNHIEPYRTITTICYNHYILILQAHLYIIKFINSRKIKMKFQKINTSLHHIHNFQYVYFQGLPNPRVLT